MIKRKFILGDKWLYYKLYCGKRDADIILTNFIKPFSEELLREGLINQWFYIRYTDPKPHLRIRFCYEQKNNLCSIIHAFNNTVKHYVDNNLIWKVQTDTYEREIERYGEDTMLESEEMFFYDSHTCIKALDLIQDDELLFLFALRSIDDLLSAFNLDNKEKLTFSESNLNAFKKEFGSDKHFNKQLSKKYQGLKDKILDFLIMTDNHGEHQKLLNLLAKKNEHILLLSEKISKKRNHNTPEMYNLLSSYVHMSTNRLFRDKQRLHELICYDSLSKFYNYKIHKKKSRI